MSPGPEGSDDAARPAPLTRRYRRYLRVEGIHAGVSIGNGMPPDRLALRRYDEFGVTWPIPEGHRLCSTVALRRGQGRFGRRCSALAGPRATWLPVYRIRCVGVGRTRESGGGWRPGSDVLPVVRLALWGARRGHGRGVRGVVPGSVTPDGSGDLPEGQGGARNRLPPVEACSPAPANDAQGCPGPGVGANQLG